MLAKLHILMLIAMLVRHGLAFVSTLDMLLALYIINLILLSFNLRKSPSRQGRRARRAAARLTNAEEAVITETSQETAIESSKL